MPENWQIVFNKLTVINFLAIFLGHQFKTANSQTALLTNCLTYKLPYLQTALLTNCLTYKLPKLQTA